MGVHRYWSIIQLDECYFGRLDGIRIVELELQPIDLTYVDRILIKYFDVKLPFF